MDPLDRSPYQFCYGDALRMMNRPGFCAAFFLVERQDSGRESARWRFRLRAGDPGEKWARAWSRDGRKYRPVVVRLAGVRVC